MLILFVLRNIIILIFIINANNNLYQHKVINNSIMGELKKKKKEKEKLGFSNFRLNQNFFFQNSEPLYSQHCSLNQ